MHIYEPKALPSKHVMGEREHQVTINMDQGTYYTT